MEIYGFANINSELNLNDLASLISENLLAGVKFGGIDENIREEVPAVYSLKEVLGLRLVLFGEVGDYGLSIEQWGDNVDDGSSIDLSVYLELLLKNIESNGEQWGQTRLK